MWMETFKYVFDERWNNGHDQYMTPVTMYTDAYIQDEKGAFELSIVPEEWASKGEWIKRTARLILTRREAKELGDVLLQLK
jgi:hypothetical protein